MIISRTPFRMSFAGGGTDLKSFYAVEPGAVVSTAIDKYMYITVNTRFDDSIRVSYSRTEIVDDVNDIRHPIVREALKTVGLDRALEITSIADIPAQTGLGSSCSFTVGLLNALYAYAGRAVSAETLASQACEIEIDRLGEPIGKQDQYIAAYGGMQQIRFQTDGAVFVDPVVCGPETRQALESSLLLFFTGQVRSSSSILSEQSCIDPGEAKFQNLRKMRDLAVSIKETLERGENLDELGELLHQGWLYKRELVQSISNSDVDNAYEKAREAGALGGKLLGAGGGGFLLFYAPPQKHDAVRNALAPLREIKIGLESQGSKIIFVGADRW